MVSVGAALTKLGYQKCTGQIATNGVRKHVKVSSRLMLKIYEYWRTPVSAVSKPRVANLTFQSLQNFLNDFARFLVPIHTIFNDKTTLVDIAYYKEKIQTVLRKLGCCYSLWTSNATTSLNDFSDTPRPNFKATRLEKVTVPGTLTEWMYLQAQP